MCQKRRWTKSKTEMYWSSIEDHYGVPWCISIKRNKDDLAVFLHCKLDENKKEWLIETESEINVFRTNGSPFRKAGPDHFTTKKGSGWERFMTWETMEKECLDNDELVVEIRVKITKMVGFEVYLRRFDDEECSDVALVVNGKKFHVSKLYLASQSSYFKSMFLGKFNESGKAEIELTGIDGYDLQKYLEMLYGEDALNDETAEGILHLADMYDTKTLIGRCEGYLLDVSRKALKEKLELSATYNLAELKVIQSIQEDLRRFAAPIFLLHTGRRKCMSKIKTIDDVRSVITERVRNLDHDTLADLLEKTLALAQ